MNGPRLLEKIINTKEAPNPNTSAKAKTIMMKDSIPLSKYMWDDDGNKEGTAKILIDSLPSRNTTVRWEDANVESTKDIKSKLLGVWKNGLMVQIRQKDNEKYVYYHLFVPKLFGEVENVKIISKAKKLIVKLYKKKAKENMQVWPQLASKIITSSDANYSKENLFEDKGD
jgi:hypothetical protein